MAVAKIVGIETEYGIMVHGAPDQNPVAASASLINSFVRSEAGMKQPVAWDFAGETPGVDARELDVARISVPPEVETHMVNSVLDNGARFYVDHAHPEYSSPECSDALELVKYDAAGEQILIDSMVAAQNAKGMGESYVVYKDNSDRKGNTYGCHENYLLDRQLMFSEVVRVATVHFVTRQIFTGSGKVGTEVPGRTSGDIGFQLTQRADHFEEPVGLETTLKRPVVNTRDEPHANPAKYRRLHVIVGDANMAQIATFLKVGTTAIVFAMAEDGCFPDHLAVENPVASLIEVSHDPSLNYEVEMVDGSKKTALGIQYELLEAARNWADRYGTESVGQESGKQVLELWEETLGDLSTDPNRLIGKLDWVTKRHLITSYMDRHGIGIDDHRLRALDLQYHDLRPEKNLAKRANLVELVSQEAVTAAKTEPPESTRAYFRGKALQKYREEIVAANWDSIVFDVGKPSLSRVPMLEPARGTKAHVEELINNSPNATELLDNLGTLD